MARLLLVDDAPNLILTQLHRVFDAAGHEIDTALTGEDGVRRAAARAPDAILLDLRLPDLSGLEVYRRLPQIHAPIPGIFLTPPQDAHRPIPAVKPGAFHYPLK